MENEVKTQGYRISVYVRDKTEAENIKSLIRRYKAMSHKGVELDVDSCAIANEAGMALVREFATKICTEIESRTLKTEITTPKKLESWMSREQKYDFFVNRFPNVPEGLLYELVDSWISDEERYIMSLDLYGLIEYKNKIMRKSNLYDVRLFEAARLNQAGKNEIQSSRGF